MPKTSKPDHITQEDWDAVDSPDLTKADFAKMRPAADVLPILAQKSGKVKITLEIDAETVAQLKAVNKHWEASLRQTVRRAIKKAAEQVTTSRASD
mgnify:CR=1 FL=1